MDIFFNELSIRLTSDAEEAREWLENLAKLGQLLKRIIESLEEDSFTFRRNEDFALQKITDTQTISDFLQSEFDFSDPVYVFLLGIFDSPYITEDDPQRTKYDLTSITINHTDYEVTGIAAAYLKNSLAVSLDSGIEWDTCRLEVLINQLNEAGEIISELKPVKHACKRQHIIDCHLSFLATLYDWASYKPVFAPENEKQNILSLKEIYSLCLGEDEDVGDVWENFYQEISHLGTNQRIDKITKIVNCIAEIQRWKKATGSLEKRNRDRTIYTIPNSDFIVSVDTQHGEFEIHKNQKGNNHLGAISFDGKEFKNKKDDRSLKL